MDVYKIDIQKTFSDFVEVFGGEVTDRTVRPTANLPKNADFIFRKDNIVAELKCLEEDLESKEEFKHKRQALVDKWASAKIIHPPLPGEMIYTKELPEECQRDLTNLYGRPIKTHIQSANRQIRQTTSDLNMPTSKGLLLLAN